MKKVLRSTQSRLIDDFKTIFNIQIRAISHYSHCKEPNMCRGRSGEKLIGFARALRGRKTNVTIYLKARQNL